MIKIKLKPCCKECVNKDINIRDQYAKNVFGILRQHISIECSHCEVCEKFNADGDNRDDFWMADKGQVDFCIHEKENRELMIAREAVSKLNGLRIPEVIGHDIKRTLDSIMRDNSELTLACLYDLVVEKYIRNFTNMDVLAFGDDFRRIFSKLPMSTMAKIGWPLYLKETTLYVSLYVSDGTVNIVFPVDDLEVLK